MPQLDGLEVYRSTIHGYGVRALRPFRKGDIVIVGDGVLWREDEEFDDEYALILPPYERSPNGQPKPLYYDLADQTRWINHSCVPNTEVDTKWDPSTRHLTAWWFAIRDIEPGAEITYDYAFSGHLAVPCFCKMQGCRGLIVDPDEAHLAPEKYRDMLRADLRRPVRLSGAGGS